MAVTCHWAGGVRTGHVLTRPVRRLAQLSTCQALLERIGGLHATGLSAPAIAATLDREGWRPPKRRATFTAGMVRGLLRRRGVRPEARDAPSLTAERRSPAEVTLRELAERLAMPEQTVYRWLRRGELRARRASAGRRPVWLVTADADEIERLRALRAAGPPGRGSGSRAPTPSDS